MKYFLLFLSGFIIDIIWALYIKTISNNKYFLASIYSVGTGICAMYFTYEIAVTKDLLTGIPYLIGLFFGTLFSKYLNQ
jgi:hypothetical protein